MKKIGIRISFVLLLLFLIACENNTKLDNTLSKVNLSDREKILLSSASDESFVFEFQADDKYKQVSLWVEKYEFGRLTEENIGRMTTEIEENGMLIFSISKMSFDEEIIIFNMSVGDDASSSKITTHQVLPTESQSIWGSNPLESIPITDQMVLATICYAKGNGMSSPSTEFYAVMDNRIGEIANYDVVYVWKSEFH
ncbi:hypothetical protein [Psychrobacillus soli]|uniref:Lipoprotein n=1 Tax=Psychrobacillus soli TaxID=1543965 RepID=A0A544SHX5_9BACI|nr:hypothetical protein [Psychrobacillus soli]TQR04797.1 hypothetical protein FG383_20095 [Psychrobacillus soli]